MAYVKKTVQEYITETEDETVEGFNDNQEDRIASGFNDITTNKVTIGAGGLTSVGSLETDGNVWSKGLKLGEANSVNSMDMNNVIATGIYQGYNMTNSANATISTFLIINYSDSWVSQLQFVLTPGSLRTYQRAKTASGWTNWESIK